MAHIPLGSTHWLSRFLELVAVVGLTWALSAALTSWLIAYQLSARDSPSWSPQYAMTPVYEELRERISENLKRSAPPPSGEPTLWNGVWLSANGE